ncbi:MAG: DUF1592 domain-containing protein [Verrucomicrobiales bacterium]|nr:DUF1592 domain-containing protein [Verrucomicrobiales bacterium]
MPISRTEIVLICLLFTSLLRADQSDHYFDKIEPILIEYCFDCHGDNVAKGDFSLDEFDPDDLESHLKDHGHWLTIWENVRSDIMPPSDKPLPSVAEKRQLMEWIEKEVFRLDPNNPDPGRVTVRRLNRQEYRYTIRDLFSFEFNTSEFFPADDTGHGFDTIGDVLSMSPLVTQKYLDAAQEIVSKVVVTDSVIPETSYWWNQFKAESDKKHHKQVRFDSPGKHLREFSVSHPGEYEMELVYAIPNASDETDSTAHVIVSNNGTEIIRKNLAWGDTQWTRVKQKVKLGEGKQVLSIAIEPHGKPAEGQNTLTLKPERIVLTGPLDGSHKVYPGNYKRIFIDGPPPEDEANQLSYAEKLIKHWGLRILRRPVSDERLQKLIGMQKSLQKSGLGFEESFGQCLTAMLASPGFIFRSESQPEPNNPSNVVPIDEFALASRLSYFLWSSTPDQKLLDFAAKGELRKNLDAEIDRLLKDSKVIRFIENFTGQWLQTRDIHNVNISARRVLKTNDSKLADKYYNYNTRRAMKDELHLLFSHILKENRPVLEFLTADYTFVNESLAFAYGIPNIKGSKMQKISLPANSPRGGILGSGGFLTVTSNPTRTSPVKRGLFVLEHLLATPAPPAPEDVPTLESQKKKEGKDLTMRELMEIHRKEAQCASCHQRMDPIGLALENFNAIGGWRDEENGTPIDAAGKLVTGESFSNAKELSHILASGRSKDFYRCLTSKLLTYGLGRGVEFYDAPTIDQIVASLESGDNRFQSLIRAVIHSAPFQKRRGDQSH